METLAKLTGLPIWQILFLVFVAWFVGSCIYNIFFHPLSRVPGPKVAAATRLYEFYFEVLKSPGGQYIFEVDRLHDLYGPIVRINPREVHFRDVDFYDKLLAPRGRVDKDPFFCQSMGMPMNSFGTSAHDDHKPRRQALNPFFSHASISALESKQIRLMDRMCQMFDTYASRGKPVNIRDAAVCVTIDMISEWAFGESVNALGSDRFNHQWEEMISGASEAAPLAKCIPGIVQLFDKLPVGVVRAMDPLVGTYMDFVEWIDRHVQEHRTSWQAEAKPFRDAETKAGDQEASNEEARNLTKRDVPVIRALLESPLLPASDKGQERMKQESVGVFGGALETSSSMLARTVFYLLDSDPSLKLIPRLRSELSNIRSDPFSWKKLEQLPLLTAVVKEGLRVANVVTTRLPRLRREALQYNDYTLPPGSVLSVSSRDMLLDPVAYPDPETFSPDRWLNANESQKKHMDKCFVPFSRGPRMCVGFQFANMQIYHFLATLFFGFDVELTDTIFERDVKCVRDYLVGKSDKASKGIFVKIKGRNKNY